MCIENLIRIEAVRYSPHAGGDDRADLLAGNLTIREQQIVTIAPKRVQIAGEMPLGTLREFPDSGFRKPPA